MSQEREQEQNNHDREQQHHQHERERERERDDDDRYGERKVKRGSGELCPTSLLVRNVSYRVTTGEIRAMMEKHGEVRDVYIPLDHHTGRSRGFAFVEFFDARDAK